MVLIFKKDDGSEIVIIDTNTKDAYTLVDRKIIQDPLSRVNKSTYNADWGSYTVTYRLYGDHSRMTKETKLADSLLIQIDTQEYRRVDSIDWRTVDCDMEKIARLNLNI